VQRKKRRSLPRTGSAEKERALAFLQEKHAYLKPRKKEGEKKRLFLLKRKNQCAVPQHGNRKKKKTFSSPGARQGHESSAVGRVPEKTSPVRAKKKSALHPKKKRRSHEASTRCQRATLYESVEKEKGRFRAGRKKSFIPISPTQRGWQKKNKKTRAGHRAGPKNRHYAGICSGGRGYYSTGTRRKGKPTLI